MKKTILSLLALSFATQSFADDNLETIIEKNITQTMVKESATAESKPDMFKTTIEFRYSDDSARDAQLNLNKKIESVTNKVKLNKVEYSLSNFNTFKEYKSELQTARQTITLESKNKDLIEKLTTELQLENGKVVASSSYLSNDFKEKQFNELFKKAYNKATEKAKMITRTLGGTRYIITNLNYYTNNRTNRPMAMMKTMTVNESVSNMEVDNSKKSVTLELTLNIAILRK